MKRFLVLAIFTVPCWSSTLDQSFVSGGGTLATNINECCKFVAQTYTAGLTGTLAGVDIDVTSGAAFPLDVQIQSVTGGIPTGTILGDTTLGSSSSVLGSLVTFPQIILQVAGTQYAIVLDYPTAPFVPGGSGQGVGVWAGATGDVYSGGQDLLLTETSWNDAGAGYDSHFQTFVTTPDPSTLVPEPSTLALMMIAGIVSFLLRDKIIQSRGASERSCSRFAPQRFEVHTLHPAKSACRGLLRR